MEEILVTVVVEAVGAVFAALIVLALRRLWSSAQNSPGALRATPARPVRLAAVPMYI